ncbi:putative Mg2+ transporter protein, CorA-like/Zinc transport protein ZntB [Septoria linicola]|nr:putative Mg2+ transporter protein, CorA-like/Zinc transport protein ZntB [Septoria linicola]
MTKERYIHDRERRFASELIDRQAEEIDVIGYRDFEPRRDRKQGEARDDFERVRARSEEARTGNGGAQDSDADEDDDDVESDIGSDDGWNYEFDLSFLPSIHSDDSAEKDTVNGSTNALLLPGHRQDHVRRRGPLLEYHIASTRWTGSTFDDSPFGADVFTLSSPPTKFQKPMLRWMHLERPMPSFEEFSSTAQEVLEVTAKSRRHVGDVLRKLQRTNEQQRQQGRDMKPFCEADLDIEQRGDQTQQTSSICALSIPFFCLEKSIVNQLKSLASGSPEHPSRPLVQSHTRMLNETRELAQAVTTLGSTPNSQYLHVSQLWCLLVNDETLVTCSKLPVSQLSKTLSFAEITESSLDTFLRLRAGHSRRWHLPSSIASSLPSFFSIITDQFTNILGSRPEVEMKYHGKSITFSNWKALVDDIFKTKSEVKLTSGLGYILRPAQSHALQHSKDVAGVQPHNQRQEVSSEPATAAAQPLPRDVELPATPLPAVAESIMVFAHSGGRSPKALSKLATNLHQTLCSVQHKIIRQSYSACAELDRSAIESWLDEQDAGDGVKRGSKRSRIAQAMKSQKILTARLAIYISDFFWPKDFDHIATRKFWGALHEVLAGDTFFGNGAVSKSKDLEMSRDLLETLTDRIFEFMYSFTTAFAGQEVELYALPEQFFKAWLHVVSTFTIAANIRPKSTYDESWVLPQKQILSAKRALQEGESLLTTRLRKASLEDFEVCSSRGIVALMLDCVTRDIMHGRPDVFQTYSDYCKQLEAKIVAEPLSRSHQETLRALQQEIEAITTVLAHQLEVVTYFESSIRDLNCGERLPELPILRNSRQDLVLRQCKANINSRIDQFEALQGRATELGAWHMSEIDTNKDRQEAAIMVFTIVTIIFLPLSFVSSVFGMNTEDIRDMTQGQWAYWAAAVPLTIIVVGVSLWFAGAFDTT